MDKFGVKTVLISLFCKLCKVLGTPLTKTALSTIWSANISFCHIKAPICVLLIVAHRLTILNVDDCVKEAIDAYNNNELQPPASEPQLTLAEENGKYDSS